MKFKNFGWALLTAAMTVSAYAGDGKDMKQVAAAASDSDAGFYIAIEGGANFAQSYDRKEVRTESANGPAPGATSYYGHGSDSLGAVGGLRVGYDFASLPLGGRFRLQPAVELESYYLNSYSKETSQSDGSNSYFHRTEFNDAAFLANGILRLKTGTLFTPYCGVGIGGEYVSNDHNRITNLADGDKYNQTNNDDLDFAVQALAGFDVEVAKGWSLFAEYKYLGALDPDLTNSYQAAGGFTVNRESRLSWYSQNLVVAGLKYKF
jgi:opacity protein-like surface antigen